MKTISPVQLKYNKRKWYITDAEWINLWKLASKIATVLRWKNKVDFTYNLDNGDYVIVTNCNKFKVTWTKMFDKIYYRHTGFIWGLKKISLENILKKKPAKALELAVNGMLPKNKLRASIISRLKLFNGTQHSFNAQKPVKLEIK